MQVQLRIQIHRTDVRFMPFAIWTLTDGRLIRSRPVIVVFICRFDLHNHHRKLGPQAMVSKWTH